MSGSVTLIPGDGIGPSVMDAACRVVSATGVPIEWDVQQVGMSSLERSGEPLPRRAIDSILNNGIALKGPVSTPIGRRGFRSVNIALRRELDLFAQVRPCQARAVPHVATAELDVVVIRDTMEDLYAGVELEAHSAAAAEVRDTLERHAAGIVPEDAGMSIKYLSQTACDRIARFAFDYALHTGRTKVTAVHKASVMRCTDGLFLDAVTACGERAPGVEYDDVLVDNLCGALAHKGSRYDVLVMPNMYGDIVSDLAAGLIGGVGLVPGANYGPDVAMFEPAHGSAPRHAGAGRANPTAAILSAAMLLEHLGERAAAEAVVTAVDETIGEGAVTYDLRHPDDARPPLGTDEFAGRVIAKI
ncbi:MAG: isocitrate/isopropylmalate dehydrogenase family protein [Solirubrobacteraceae bacterium]